MCFYHVLLICYTNEKRTCLNKALITHFIKTKLLYWQENMIIKKLFYK